MNKGIIEDLGDREKLLRIVEYYSGVVELLPDEPSGYFNRGFSYFLLEEYEKAYNDFNKVVQMEPDNIVAICLRGFANEGINEHRRAMMDFLRALELDPTFGKAYLGLALIKIRHGSFEEGISYLDRALDLEPTGGKGYLYRGEANFRAKMFGEAIEDFEEALRLNPDLIKFAWKSLGQAHFHQGEFYKGEGKYELALFHINKAISLNPDKAEYYFLRGEIYLELKNSKEAEQDFESVIRIDPLGELAEKVKKLKGTEENGKTGKESQQ